VPYGSVIIAVMNKYRSLTASLFYGSSIPPIYLDQAPQENPGAVQLRPPYTIIEDTSGEPEWTFVNGPQTSGQDGILYEDFSLEVFYSGNDALANATAAMNAILWNGSVPNSRQGLGFCTLDLASPLRSMMVIPKRSLSKYHGLDWQEKRVYSVKQWFKAPTQLVGAGYS
jgi:hypothetical protein